MKTLTNKNRLDVVKIFLHFVASVGDCEKTALACDLDPQTVRDLAASEGWTEKVRRLSLVSKSNGTQAGEYERMANRAMAWVQGHRLRSILDRVICALDEKDNDELIADMTSTDKEGNKKMSARLFSDLAKSLETVNGLCFAALADTVPERSAMTGDEKANTAKVHAALIAALNGPGVKQISSEQLVSETAKAINSVSERPTLEAEVVPSTERKSLPFPPSEVGPANDDHPK